MVHTRTPPRTVPAPRLVAHCCLQRVWAGKMSPSQRKASPEPALLTLLRSYKWLAVSRLCSLNTSAQICLFQASTAHSPLSIHIQDLHGLTAAQHCPALPHLLFSSRWVGNLEFCSALSGQRGAQKERCTGPFPCQQDRPETPGAAPGLGAPGWEPKLSSPAPFSCNPLHPWN